MPQKAKTQNAINMKDLYPVTTDSKGGITVILDNPCTVQVPDLVHVRAVLAQDYSDPTAPVPVTLPAGTRLKVDSVKKDMGRCFVTLTGPGNETLSGAVVDMFFASFEFAK